jgi:[acyl-carrier-protein] S-malonyltransferase
LKVAFLFGGQGTELPRMGLDLARDVPAAAALLDVATEVAGIDARKLLSIGGPELARTSVLQPLLVAVGLGACAALANEGVVPELCAGHSLGELTAWAAAGAMGHRDAVALAGVRGCLMEGQAARHRGGMVAVVAADAPQVQELVAVAGRVGSVAVAAHNAPTDWTLSGDERALSVITTRTGATRLPVSGAWHSPAMADAVIPFAEALRDTRIIRERAEVVANRDGSIVSSDALRGLLAGQLVRPVQWAASMNALALAGATHYLVLGPSKLMRALVHKNLGRAARVLAIETFADVTHAVTELRG